MKKQKGFFKKEERTKVDLFWKDILIETLGDSTLTSKEDTYNIITELQNIFNDTTEKPLKTLSELDRVMCQKVLRNPKFDD